jgi:hypothetical protein|tara:strand:+ start:250 stop:411 length:162 start_codon:yes stop_codon:yes gene_type:complete
MIDNKLINVIIKQLDKLIESYEKSIDRIKFMKKKIKSGYKPEKNYMRKLKVKK